MSTSIKYDFWLTFADNGTSRGPVPRITKGEPHTDRGERAVRCTATLPSSLFTTPMVSVTIDVADQGRPDIEAKAGAAADAFKAIMGMDVDLVFHTIESEEQDDA